ncbi:galactosylceramide sulfotransferase-like isoform X2 [Rhipicephalus microplus]|uniref:galactosylceramide sulfotransferase-like isoform X2 n=1 Tax=Rhipicephalus microplus TaxID=6941 RepID=UPI003F6A8502
MGDIRSTQICSAVPYLKGRTCLMVQFLMAMAWLMIFFSATKFSIPDFSTIGRSWWVKQPSFNASLRSCSAPRHTVCFLKTHKCASSSVQNLLMRYGERHRLMFALPRWDVYLGNRALLNRTMAMGTPPFDMLVHHTRFQEAEARALLKSDPVFVTIVREPAALFESLYSYYDLESQLNVSLEDLRNATEKSSLAKQLRLILPGPKRITHGLNQMSYDLGFDLELAQNESAVRDFIERLDAVFDLVMVAERMNESLVLLRHLLCWELDDIITFKLNARQVDFRRLLSNELATELRALNQVDALLYEHFTLLFEQRVEAFGRKRMQEELALLEQRTSFWYERCVEEEIRADKKDKDIFTDKVLTLIVRNASSDLCARMTEPELRFTKRLRLRQRLK